MKQQIKPRLINNIIWNFLGQGVPLILAVIFIPSMVKSLGIERLGLLTLVWALVGYLSLLDFGISRSMTKRLSEVILEKNNYLIGAIFFTGSILIVLIGILVAILLFSFNDEVVDLINISPELVEETNNTISLVGLVIPITMLTAAFRGMLEAYLAFRLASQLRMLLGSINFLTPAIALIFTKRLDVIVMLLVFSRIVICVLFFISCMKVSGLVFKHFVFLKAEVSHLASFGRWIMISNMVSPLMTYLDRFIIGGYVAAAFIAYYTMPYEMLNKILIIPASIAIIVFPHVAAARLNLNDPQFEHLIKKSYLINWILCFPVVFLTAVFSKEIWTVWLNSSFAINAKYVIIFLSIGLLINAYGYIVYAVIQGIGRADITAKLHLVELVVFLPTLVILVKYFAITGAAITWASRVIVDSILLSIFHNRLIPFLKPVIIKFFSLFFCSGIIIFQISLIDNIKIRATLSLFLLLTMLIILPPVLLTASERKMIYWKILKILRREENK